MSAIAWALLLPAIAAGLVWLLGRWPNAREGATLTVGVLTLGAVLKILPEVIAGGRPEFDVITVLPGLELGFQVEPLGMLFALVASSLWIVTTLYAIGYMRGHHEINQTRFFMCFALAITGALGVAFARNLFTLFLFYEFLTLSTYPLVTHHGTEEARAGGRVYLGILLTTSVCFLLLAVIWTWHLAGTLEFVPGGFLAETDADPTTLKILLALFMFGTGKAALMPFHRWLPNAMVAPTPVSALLHAVAVVKAGVFTVLKVITYVFGLDLIQEYSLSDWLMVVAAATILLASLRAMTLDNLKARLAYSTISQLSYIVLGGALANDLGLMGGAMHIPMHAFGKITLFFCAGAILVGAHKKNISEMDGLGREMPFTFFAFFVGALSVTGLPPMGGAWSKWYLALGAADAGQVLLVATLMVSSLLNIAYLMPIPARAFFMPPKAAGHGHHADHHGDDHHGDDHGHHGVSVPFLCVAPPIATATVCVILFFSADGIYQLLLPLTEL